MDKYKKKIYINVTFQMHIFIPFNSCLFLVYHTIMFSTNFISVKKNDLHNNIT